MRGRDLHLASALLREHLLEHGAILEVVGHVNERRYVLGVEIALLDYARQELAGVELVSVLPIQFSAVDDAAVAHVKDVDRHQRRLGVDAEDVDVVSFGGGHLLPLLQLLDGCDEVAQARGLLEVHVL